MLGMHFLQNTAKEEDDGMKRRAAEDCPGGDLPAAGTIEGRATTVGFSVHAGEIRCDHPNAELPVKSDHV
jgi:hypothetical protein